MSLTKDTANVRLTRELLEAEHATSQALVAATQLMATMARAHHEVGEVPIMEAQKTMLRQQKTVESLLGVRGDLARTHQSLKGIRNTMWFDGEVPDDCLIGSIDDVATAKLRVA